MSVYRFISSQVYNRFCQSPEIQKISAGIWCLRKGKQLLCNPDPSSNQSLLKKVGRTAAAIGSLGAGLAAVYSGASSLFSSDTWEGIFEKAPPLTPIGPLKKEDPYEAAFRRSKPIELLFIGGGKEADHNGALNPLGPGSPVLHLDTITRLEYGTIEHPLEICDKIRSIVSKNGEELPNLVISTHGTTDRMLISPFSTFQVFDSLPENCFEGLHPFGRIFLISCSTAGYSFWKPNMAEWVAWISGREVIAPFGNVAGRFSDFFINPESNRLDATFVGDGSEARPHVDLLRECPFYEDLTREISISNGYEKTIFSLKLMVPTFLGMLSAWQTMRLGAISLQGGGAAAEWIVDRSSGTLAKITNVFGMYHPTGARYLYQTTKMTCKALNFSGKAINKGMDLLVSPIEKLGSWMFKKSVFGAINAAKYLCGKQKQN